MTWLPIFPSPPSPPPTPPKRSLVSTFYSSLRLASPVPPLTEVLGRFDGEGHAFFLYNFSLKSPAYLKKNLSLFLQKTWFLRNQYSLIHPESSPNCPLLTVNWNFPLFTSPPSPPPLSSPPPPPLDPPPSFSPFLSAPDPRAKASDLPLCVFFDGASCTVPFQGGSGAVVYHYGEEIASFTTTTPFATSNQAGIDALNLATYFCPRNVRSLLVFGDSEIIIKGLQNNSPPKEPPSSPSSPASESSC